MNVMETTLIALSIGLSFDYTMHVAMAYMGAGPSILPVQRLRQYF